MQFWSQTPYLLEIFKNYSEIRQSYGAGMTFSAKK